MTQKTIRKYTFVNEYGVRATVEIHFVGKYHYWFEVNGCQENREVTIPNPWTIVDGKKVDVERYNPDTEIVEEA